MVSKVVKDTKEGDDGEASGDDGSGWYWNLLGKWQWCDANVFYVLFNIQ